MWLCTTPFGTNKIPNYLTFAGDNPVNSFDGDGRSTAQFYRQNPTLGLGADNGPMSIYYGIAPVMETHTETTMYLNDGTHFTEGAPGDTGALYNPKDVTGYSQNIVTQPTGQFFSYLSTTPLPDNYGKTTVTPVDLEQQANLQFLKAAGVIIVTALTDTEEAAPEMLAEGTAARTATQLEFNFANDFGQNSGLVIGRGADLSAPGALGTGEYKFGWFSVQSTSGMDAEWAVNQAKLQNVMNLNLPIRDASSLLDTGGFYLNNERSMLQSAGWNYRGGYWVPPTH